MNPPGLSTVGGQQKLKVCGESETKDGIFQTRRRKDRAGFLEITMTGLVQWLPKSPQQATLESHLAIVGKNASTLCLFVGGLMATFLSLLVPMSCL